MSGHDQKQPSRLELLAMLGAAHNEATAQRQRAEAAEAEIDRLRARIDEHRHARHLEITRKNCDERLWAALDHTEEAGQ